MNARRKPMVLLLAPLRWTVTAIAIIAALVAWPVLVVHAAFWNSIRR